MNPIRFAGIACILGGVAFFGDLGLHLFGGLGRGYFVFAALMGLCLVGGPEGLRMLRVVGPGWRTPLGRIGATVVLVGIALWLAAFTLLFFNPDAAFSQKLTPGGSLLMALGMIVLGVATASSGLLRGWRRWMPLLVGVYFPLQLVVQLTFFLNGRDGGQAPMVYCSVCGGCCGRFLAMRSFRLPVSPASLCQSWHVSTTENSHGRRYVRLSLNGLFERLDLVLR